MGSNGEISEKINSQKKEGKKKKSFLKFKKNPHPPPLCIKLVSKKPSHILPLPFVFFFLHSFFEKKSCWYPLF